MITAFIAFGFLTQIEYIKRKKERGKELGKEGRERICEDNFSVVPFSTKRRGGVNLLLSQTK